MADQEQIESEEVVEIETEEAADETNADGAEPESTADDDEIVVSIGEESPPPEASEQAPEWVRELRKKNREDQKRIRELEDKLKSVTEVAKPTDLGKKPGLEDFDYDTDKYEQELAAWYERKREYDARVAEQNAEAARQQQEWEAKLAGYAKAKTEIKVKDFEDAEAVVLENFNQTQQGIALQGADNPALLVYALGRNPTKARELASIKDPVKFAFAIAKLETQLKVSNRKAAPPPEKTVRGTAPMSGTVDSTLERLREKAEKTGDYSEVRKYKAQLRAKQ